MSCTVTVKTIEGSDIILEEMPQGLFIFDKTSKKVVLISSVKDADLVIDSLRKMKECFGE